jgi:hypothetical protein
MGRDSLRSGWEACDPIVEGLVGLFRPKQEQAAQRGLWPQPKNVGTSGAGPKPNAVRPYITRKMFAKKTRIYGNAIQSQRRILK